MTSSLAPLAYNLYFIDFTPIPVIIKAMDKRYIKLIAIALALALVGGIAFYLYKDFTQDPTDSKIARTIASRLKTTTRKADLLVTDVTYDEKVGKVLTSVKYMEYDVKNIPLDPIYFQLDGNIIQIQSLVITLTDEGEETLKIFKDKNAYIFWKAFLPDGKTTKTVELTELNAIPAGYKLKGVESEKEKELWTSFWKYAIDPDKADNIVIRNTRIAAPGKIFIPGTLYRVRMESDGNLVVDSAFLPSGSKRKNRR